MPVYLIQFAYRHLDFWLPELDSLLEMQGLEPAAVYTAATDVDYNSPFMRVLLPSDEVAAQLASRAILIVRILELWGSGKTYDELKAAVASAPAAVKEPWFKESVSWNMAVDGFGRSFKMAEQQERRLRFAHLPFLGPVRLRGEVTARFWVFEDFGNRENGNAKARPEAIAVHLGREVRKGRRDLIDKYNLKKRSFLGPTSMDNELAFVMANMAQCRAGSLVCDPFVGTGSLLVPCTVFGSSCMGTDIDVRILKGKGGRNIRTMFTQYGLVVPSLLRMDFSPRGRALREPSGGYLDAIVCDPPYGVRAGARKSGSRRAVVKKVEEAHLKDHIPMTQPYSAQDVMGDLLDSSARLLRVGGRLVYLLPTIIEEYSDEQLPRHPLLEVVANSEQQLTTKMARRLITMRKVAPYDYGRVAEYAKYIAEGDCAYANIEAKIKRAKLEQ